MRIVLRAVFALVALYGLLLGALAIAMRQPPDRFGAIMMRVPPFAFAVLPFQTLWMPARAGHLQVGDPAPDFSLKTLDGADHVSLSSFHGKRPVVLVFGSYT